MRKTYIHYSYMGDEIHNLTSQKWHKMFGDPIYFIRTEELNTRDLTISCYFFKLTETQKPFICLNLAQNWYEIENLSITITILVKKRHLGHLSEHFQSHIIRQCRDSKCKYSSKRFSSQARSIQHLGRNIKVKKQESNATYMPLIDT